MALWGNGFAHGFVNNLRAHSLLRLRVTKRPDESVIAIISKGYPLSSSTYYI